jgi:hypothetical protein
MAGSNEVSCGGIVTAALTIFMYALMIGDGASQQMDISRPNCTTVFECSQLAVEQAAAARAALEKDKILIEELRNQLNKLENKQSSDIATTNGAVSQLKDVHFECTTVSDSGQSANCPSGFKVTGCTAGNNFASTDLGTNRAENGCFTQTPGAVWTSARCCRVSYTK